jgi:hypothetical protein
MRPFSIEVTQVRISPQSGMVEVFYQVVLENPAFSGAIGGGKTPITDPGTCKKAMDLVSIVESSLLRDLGMTKKVEEEEPLYSDNEEEDLL